MKSRKLRSPIKAIHEALVGIRLAMGNPLCVQPTKTESFRDLLASFNSVYYTPAVSSSSSLSSSVADAGSLCYHLPRQFPAADDVRVVSRSDGGEDAEDAVSVSAATASTSTACSSCLSSASATADGRDNPDAADDQLLPLTAGAINSRRFFFSPCTSKFIAAGETSFLEVGRRSDDLSDQEPDKAAEAEAEEEGKVFFDDVSPPEYSSSSDTETTLEEILAAKAPPEAALWPRQSIPMALASRDPYGDFRSSMDEMVSAHGLRDWPGLQELLHCYLRLNDRKTHKFIVLAFADLLMHLAAEGKIHKSVMHETLICASPLQHSPHGKSLSCKASFLSD